MYSNRKRAQNYLLEICNETNNIARVKAGLSEVRWHDLRHTFASRMVQCDNPLNIVQKLLGHKDQRLTQRCSHLTVKALRRGVDILGHNLVIVLIQVVLFFWNCSCQKKPLQCLGKISVEVERSVSELFGPLQSKTSSITYAIPQIL
jgi:hypothetical protein